MGCGTANKIGAVANRAYQSVLEKICITLR